MCQLYAKMKCMVFKKSLKIFLLDDDIFYMNIFQQHLANIGYHDISTFVDPLVCFDNLNPPPDIIFYDHGVDFLKGLEVLKMIKRLIHFRESAFWVCVEYGKPA